MRARPSTRSEGTAARDGGHESNETPTTGGSRVSWGIFIELLFMTGR